MATKVYSAIETPVTFTDSTGDVAITLANLAASTGMRVSVQKDRGAGSLPQEHDVQVNMAFETTPVFGECVKVYIAASDGTQEDGQVGAADAAVASAYQLQNMMFVGALKVDVQTADTLMTATFHGVPITTRYYSVVVHNGAVDNLQNDANISSVVVTPTPMESQ